YPPYSVHLVLGAFLKAASRRPAASVIHPFSTVPRTLFPAVARLPFNPVKSRQPPAASHQPPAESLVSQPISGRLPFAQQLIARSVKKSAKRLIGSRWGLAAAPGGASARCHGVGTNTLGVVRQSPAQDALMARLLQGSRMRLIPPDPACDLPGSRRMTA
ncbi:hypothetical protein, partial [Thiohalocapsa marina]|uniref:hypothetical protein n=1 Tax=Thiohalocapsa marina TaxID=424902 RepID=UPI0036D93BA3